MKTAMVIAVREVREKARLFLLCTVLALLPFAATLLPGARENRSLTIAVVGGFLAAIFGLGIAVTLGTSTVARDLSERRMSFYFTKPVSAPAIWLGKASASLFIALACAAIIAVPSFLASRQQWVMQWLGEVRPLTALALAIVALFFLAHLLSSVIRSRSPLIALDFLFLILAVGAVYLMLVPLVFAAASDLVSDLTIVLGVAVLIIFAIAPVWQLEKGRSDVRRSHAALMRFLWPAIAVVLLVAGGFVAWVIRVSPEDVAITYVDQPARGTRLIAMGKRHRFDYNAAFLIDRATGSVRRIPAPLWLSTRFSENGRAAWFEGFELHTENGPTGIPLSPFVDFVLSDDGTRVAIANGSLLAVYDLATSKLLASAAGLDGRARQQLFFVTPDLVRVIEHEHRLGVATPLRVFELDVRARKTRKTGERMLQSSYRAAAVSGDGSRMFLRGANAIVDGRTAETIATIDATNARQSVMLHDGRVALITVDGDVPHLRTFERDGTPRHDVTFPNADASWIAGETENGKLILSAYYKRTYVVDLAGGAIEQTIEGVRGPMQRLSADPRLMRFAADQELVAVDKNGKLVVWKNEGRASARPLLPSR